MRVVSWLMSHDHTVPLCPMSVPSRRPSSEYHTAGKWSLAVEIMMSPSRLYFTIVRGRECEDSRSGRMAAGGQARAPRPNAPSVPRCAAVAPSPPPPPHTHPPPTPHTPAPNCAAGRSRPLGFLSPTAAAAAGAAAARRAAEPHAFRPRRSPNAFPPARARPGAFRPRARPRAIPAARRARACAAMGAAFDLMEGAPRPAGGRRPRTQTSLAEREVKMNVFANEKGLTPREPVIVRNRAHCNTVGSALRGVRKVL